ncbi:DegV family protein [Bariatricus sp. SGI.154]|uniref:DegV family protein n=1 Tax=Bariatricus sp. SGI.154 TaxID=3420549 RepID=UPI003D00CB9F
MKTAVMTDSNSGITKAEADELGIFLMPMPVIIDGEICFEGTDLTQEMFYDGLKSGKDVSTSQPSPGDVLDMWDEILEMGYEDLVYIPMSSGLSNSCETAIGLSMDYDGKVQVADNHRISVTLRESVLEARELAQEGASAKEIKEDLEARAYDSSIYITVDTLEFLKKGGRVTPAGAALGAVLNIKPVLTIQGERLDAFAKVRGMKKGKHKMIEGLKQDLETRFRDADMSKVVIAAAGAGLTKEEEEEWTNELREAFPQVKVHYNPLSFSIACHTGPGAIGTGLVVRK